MRSLRSLGFLRPPKAIFVPGMYFLGFSRYSNYEPCELLTVSPGTRERTRVSLFHSTPFCLLASVYEKPSTWPDLRPKRPCRLGPILLPSPSFRVWHCAHRVCPVLERFCRHGELVASHLEKVGTLLSIACQDGLAIVLMRDGRAGSTCRLRAVHLGIERKAAT